MASENNRLAACRIGNVADLLVEVACRELLHRKDLHFNFHIIHFSHVFKKMTLTRPRQIRKALPPHHSRAL